MPIANTNPFFEEELLNDSRMHLALRAKAEEFIAVAREQFTFREHHRGRPPVFYNESFEIRVTERNRIPLYRIANTDETAIWVEFGAHAGGRTPVLKYRIFGTTADILEAFERGASAGGP